MEYSDKQQADIRSVFEAFNNQNITYVVPRGHQKLPASTQGGDVDVIIKETDFDTAVHLCEEVGFTPDRSIIRDISSLVIDGVRNPLLVLSMVVHAPAEILHQISNTLTPGQSVSAVNADFDDQRRFKRDIMFHLLNHAAYKSPLNDAMVRVNPEVEQSMFKHRRIVDKIAVPSMVDELVHLICRGVFDYDGEFPLRYIERCNQIRQYVIENEVERFKRLLSLVFFEASEVVFENTRRKTYNEIKSDLIKYSCY